MKASGKTEDDGMSLPGTPNPVEVIVDTNTVHRKASSCVKGNELLSRLHCWALVSQLATEFVFTQSLGYPNLKKNFKFIFMCMSVLCA